MRWLLLFVVGCGRIGFDPFGGGGDDEAPYPDAIPLGMFQAPALIAEIESAAEDDDPTLPADESEIYFSSRRGNGEGDIYRATALGGGMWSVPQPVAELNTPGDEVTPELSADGLTIYFARGSADAVQHDIFVSTRSAAGAAWSSPQPLFATEMHETAATPGTDHKSLVVSVATAVDVVSATLYLATRETTTDAWSELVPIESIDVPNAGETQAWLGETALYFTVSPNLGNYDIYRAARTGRERFATPVAVTELNTTGRDSDPWLSADERRIYFTRDDGIWFAKR